MTKLSTAPERGKSKNSKQKIHPAIANSNEAKHAEEKFLTEKKLILCQSKENVKGIMKPSCLKPISTLPDNVFEETENLLDNIHINPSKNFTIALIREEGSRIFGIIVDYADIEKVSKKGGVINKGILELRVKKGGDIDDIVVYGKKDGFLYRYGVLGYKDSEGVVLMDEENEILFGKERILADKEKVQGTQNEETTKAQIDKVPQKMNGRFRNPPIRLGYEKKFSEQPVKTSDLPDRDSVAGRVIRSIRWKKITDAAEKKYGIPQGLLLAMMAQEGYGDPTLPNLGGDGGLGLIHIQAVNAHQFGLKTLPRFNNKMRDTRHGKEIDFVKAKHHDNLFELIRYDDRFHPIMSVDVSARFLMEKYVRAKKLNPGMSEKELWNKALKFYSGRPHEGRSGYGAKVRAYQAVINSPSYIKDLKRKFPDYNKYIEHFGKMSYNYGLEKYKKA